MAGLATPMTTQATGDRQLDGDHADSAARPVDQQGRVPRQCELGERVEGGARGDGQHGGGHGVDADRQRGGESGDNEGLFGPATQEGRGAAKDGISSDTPVTPGPSASTTPATSRPSTAGRGTSP